MPDRPRVFASFMQALCGFAATLGVRPAELLAAAGLASNEIADPDQFIDYECMIRGWSFLLERFPNAPLGLTYSRLVGPEVLGVVGYACANARDLGQALELWMRYARLLDPHFEVGVLASDGVHTITLAHERRVEEMVEPIEMFVASWVRIAATMADPPPRPREIFFRHRRRHPESTYAELGAPVRFGADATGATFDSELLRRPISGADPRIGAYLVRHADSILEPVADEDDGLATRVRRAIDAGLLAGNFEQPAVARTLGMSTRSLQRALKASGTSFSAQLEAVRRLRAEELLARRDLSVAEVAFMLGYADPRPFYRSFRRWTGQTPQQFRQR